MRHTFILILAWLCVTASRAQPGSGAGGYGSVGPGGGGGATNGQSAAQVQATVANNAILKTNGIGTNTLLINMRGTNGDDYGRWSVHGQIGVDNIDVEDLSDLTINVEASDNFVVINTGGLKTKDNGGNLAFVIDGQSGVVAANGRSITNIYGTNILGGTIPITAADSSWTSQTNFIALTNGPTSRGQALVFDGVDASGIWRVKGTNWPTGGGGTVGDPLTNNFGLLQTNANTSSSILSSNAELSLQTNGSKTIILNPTTGASFNTGGSNYFGGTNYMGTNAAAFNTSSNPTNSFTVSVLYTNASQRSLLIGSAVLLDGPSGGALLNIFYTNNGVGYVLPSSHGLGVTTTEIVPFCVPLSPNATFFFSPVTGLGGTISLTNVVNWLL